MMISVHLFELNYEKSSEEAIHCLLMNIKAIEVVNVIAGNTERINVQEKGYMFFSLRSYQLFFHEMISTGGRP